MTAKDNITLPRELAEKALEALEFAERNHDGEQSLYTTEITALRTALAAEQPKQEPVAWLSRDEARLALWKAINSREFGNPTDDKLILDHLRQQGLWIGKVTSPVPPALAAEQPKLEPVVWMDRFGFVFRGKGPHETFTTPLYAAPPATHPGYVIGSHWLETAYSRVCAGEAEADVLRDCGWERVDQALRRDAERYRYLRDKAYVWDSDMPKAMRPVALWLHADGNANIDAAIDAAMGDKR